ncbi:hypothetical protein MPC1_1810002 [Methylocella tundrae]|nr:hypothetical protein MPC1_1810002 [Methylocella tundrae]
MEVPHPLLVDHSGSNPPGARRAGCMRIPKLK